MKNTDLKKDKIKELEEKAKQALQTGTDFLEIKTDDLLLLCRTINAERFRLSQLNKKYSTARRELKNASDVDLKNKHLANCQKCGRMGVECFTTTIEEYDIYEKMLCEDCLIEMIDKKMSAIEHKKIE